MKKLAILLVLFLTPSLFAQEKFKLTPYQPKTGDTFTVTDTEVENMNLTFNGMAIQNDEKTTTVEYTETILEVKDGTVTKRERTYAKCTQKSAQGEKKYGFVGKTVVIIGTGKNVKIECKDGSKLGFSDQSYLKRKFGKKNPMSGADSFYPKEAVAVGETWNIPVEKFAKETDMPKDMFDQKTSTLKGTLKKIYEKDGVKMGDIDCEIKFNVGNFPRLQNSKGQFVMTFTVSVCIDGSKNFLTMKGKGDFDVTGDVKSPQGDGKMVMKMKISGDKTVAPK